MKLLITGEPRSGKSTLLRSLIETIPDKKFGFITSEVLEAGERIGFDVKASNGKTVPLARTHDLSKLTVGKYSVNPRRLDELIDNLGGPSADDLIYMDEIGQMQFLSNGFADFINSALKADNDLLATISAVYRNTDIERILSDDQIILLKVTSENRDVMLQSAEILLDNAATFNALHKKTQAYVVKLANKYINNAEYVCLKKLFKNAIHYSNGSVERTTNIVFMVHGKHADHKVIYHNEDNWQCDCPLSQGLYPSTVLSECSHYMAVNILLQNKEYII